MSSRAPSLQQPRTRLHAQECNDLKPRLPTQQTDEDPLSAIGNRNLEGVFSSPPTQEHLLASGSAQSKHFQAALSCSRQRNQVRETSGPFSLVGKQPKLGSPATTTQSPEPAKAVMSPQSSKNSTEGKSMLSGKRIAVRPGQVEENKSTGRHSRGRASRQAPEERHNVIKDLLDHTEEDDKATNSFELKNFDQPGDPTMKDVINDLSKSLQNSYMLNKGAKQSSKGSQVAGTQQNVTNSSGEQVHVMKRFHDG